jgi:hypothetical protein
MKKNLILDSNLGTNIPKAFIERGFHHIWDNISEEAVEILREGPEHEHYWDAWDEVLNSASGTSSDGTNWRLEQDGDLWMVEQEKQEKEEKEPEKPEMPNLATIPAADYGKFLFETGRAAEFESLIRAYANKIIEMNLERGASNYRYGHSLRFTISPEHAEWTVEITKGRTNETARGMGLEMVNEECFRRISFAEAKPLLLEGEK